MFVVATSLGRPKPLQLEFECPTSVAEADVLGSFSDEAGGRILFVAALSGVRAGGLQYAVKRKGGRAAGKGWRAGPA